MIITTKQAIRELERRRPGAIVKLESDTDLVRVRASLLYNNARTFTAKGYGRGQALRNLACKVRDWDNRIDEMLEL